MRILIADDDPVVAQVVRAGLGALGWRVEVAADAMQAVMFANRSPPEAIILDFNMPGGTGLTALERLRASMKTRYVPVLVLSATQDPTVRSRGEALGAAGFLAKPVDIDILHAELCRIIGRAPAANEGM
ncbi:MAG TPA: response regulator [Longimicrobium sp.]|nr:response regulator [Longimicrobium sp.]